MKTIKFLSVIIIAGTISLRLSAQDEKVKAGYGEPVTQVQPHYPGGDDSLRAFLSRSLRNPNIVGSNKEEGRVYVSFTVEKTGKISDITVLNGVSETLDKEAVKIVQMMPDWEPGTASGQPMDMQYIMAIDFLKPKSVD